MFSRVYLLKWIFSVLVFVSQLALAANSTDENASSVAFLIPDEAFIIDLAGSPVSTSTMTNFVVRPPPDTDFDLDPKKYSLWVESDLEFGLLQGKNSVNESFELDTMFTYSLLNFQKDKVDKLKEDTNAKNDNGRMVIIEKEDGSVTQVDYIKYWIFDKRKEEIIKPEGLSTKTLAANEIAIKSHVYPDSPAVPYRGMASESTATEVIYMMVPVYLEEDTDETIIEGMLNVTDAKNFKVTSFMQSTCEGAVNVMDSRFSVDSETGEFKLDLRHEKDAADMDLGENCYFDYVLEHPITDEKIQMRFDILAINDTVSDAGDRLPVGIVEPPGFSNDRGGISVEWLGLAIVGGCCVGLGFALLIYFNRSKNNAAEDVKDPENVASELSQLSNENYKGIGNDSDVILGDSQSSKSGTETLVPLASPVPGPNEGEDIASMVSWHDSQVYEYPETMKWEKGTLDSYAPKDAEDE